MNIYGFAGGDESNPVYQMLAAENTRRHYTFLDSMIETAVLTGQLEVSHNLIKALNFHAVVGLHPEAGVYRDVAVTAGTRLAPPPDEVLPRMNAFVDFVKAAPASVPSSALATYVLSGINYIHPFVNGNGRTARAMCYFIICTRAGGPLPGDPALPELLRTEYRDEYVDYLVQSYAGDYRPLLKLIDMVITRQLQ